MKQCPKCSRAVIEQHFESALKLVDHCLVVQHQLDTARAVVEAVRNWFTVADDGTADGCRRDAQAVQRMADELDAYDKTREETK
jgi:hypothetical protein